MQRIPMRMLEVYMTNVCNFNCPDCNRLNNYKFSGHSLWENHKDDFKRWGEKVEPRWINILGGEPFLNRDLPNWIVGLRSCWPNAQINLLTNGSQLDLVPDLYNLLQSNNTVLGICLHDKNRYHDMVDKVRSLLISPLKEISNCNLDEWVNVYNQVKADSWPECQSYKDFDSLPDTIKEECVSIHRMDPVSWQMSFRINKIIDSNGVTVTISDSDYFVTAPLKYNGNNQFVVYNSDREKAHDVCVSKYCTEIVDGKMYKCHHVALLPKFMEQYHVEISDEDRRMLLDYQPLSSDASMDEIRTFVNNLNLSIPQCKLCPENLEANYFSATTNKPKVKKIFQIMHENK